MKLSDFLAALSNKNINVTLSENGEEIISFVSAGVAGIEGDILEKEVKKWSIDGVTSMSVIIGDTATP